MSFVHLHTHSHYTLLTALPTTDQLLARAQELGMTSLALTDTNNLYGAVEFYTKAKNYGIKPIIGAEVLVTKNLHSKNNTAEDRRRQQFDVQHAADLRHLYGGPGVPVAEKARRAEEDGRAQRRKSPADLRLSRPDRVLSHPGGEG